MTSTFPQRAFIYARKSTDSEDRQIFSLDHQLKELRELAIKAGIEIVAEFIESQTAKIPGRPVFSEMLARMKKGEANGILAWKPDRLAHNGVDGGQIMHLVDTGIIANLKFVAFWFEPTPQGKLMLAIEFGMAKYYVDSLSQGIKRNYRHRISEGFWPRRPPLGYLFDRNTRTVIPDPVRAPLIRKVFELYSTEYYTLEHLTLEANDLGLRSRESRNCPSIPLSRSRYHELLRNPFYAGVLRYHGELFDGKHEPLVSARLFDRCQMILAERSSSRNKVCKTHLYQGMFTCTECGCAITCEIQKGHTYLRCTKRKGPCSQPYVREQDASEQIRRIIRRCIWPPETVAAMVEDLRLQQKEETSLWAENVSHLKITIVAFDDKLQRLTTLYIDGTLSAEEFKRRKARIITDRRICTENLTVLEKNHKTPLEPAIHFIRGLVEPQNVIDSANPVMERDFFKKVGSNLKIRHGRILWEPRGP